MESITKVELAIKVETSKGERFERTFANYAELFDWVTRWAEASMIAGLEPLIEHTSEQWENRGNNYKGMWP